LKKIVTVIQARTGSSRLPGKVTKEILGKPLLIRMVERVQASVLKGTVVVATTLDAEDELIESICEDNRILCYRGSSLDLLDRHYQAGKWLEADAVVKIPSDCPLIDPHVIDKVLQYFLDNDFDYVSNLHPATYPDGNDVEVMSFNTLETAWSDATKDFEREHTTPYLWEHPEKFSIGNVVWGCGLDYSMSHRFTIDYAEDFIFIRTIYESLYPLNPDFSLQDILNLLRTHPEITSINERYAGVNWYRNHINELKTVTEAQTKHI
jgi:spore coat polysaccharide biosynthesis protein SpsF